MIIGSGILKGRSLATLGREPWLRPTSDKAREALLDMLRPILNGVRFVDVCAGTGAVGIEALSNGAARAVFVDNGSKSVRLIRKNVGLLNLEGKVTILEEDAEHYAASLTGNEFDILFADPPFDSGLQQRLLTTMADHLRRDSDGCIIIMEHATRQPVSECYEGPAVRIEMYKERRYGDVSMTFYRVNSRSDIEGAAADA